MRRLACIINNLLILLSVCATGSYAQSDDNQLVRGYYWIDDNFNSPSYFTLENSPSQTIVYELSTSHIPSGLHQLHLRFSDSRGNKSAILSSYFFKVPELSANPSGMNISHIELWINNGVKKSFEVSGENISFLHEESLNLLPPGLHLLNIRVFAENNIKSSVLSEYLYKFETDNQYMQDPSIVSSVEYWYNYSNRNRFVKDISSYTGDVFTWEGDDAVNRPWNFYSIHFRFRDIHGKYSPVYTHHFDNNANVINEIVSTEDLSGLTMPDGNLYWANQTVNVEGVVSSVQEGGYTMIEINSRNQISVSDNEYFPAPGDHLIVEGILSAQDEDIKLDQQGLFMQVFNPGYEREYKRIRASGTMLEENLGYSVIISDVLYAGNKGDTISFADSTGTFSVLAPFYDNDLSRDYVYEVKGLLSDRGILSVPYREDYYTITDTLLTHWEFSTFSMIKGDTLSILNHSWKFINTVQWITDPAYVVAGNDSLVSLQYDSAGIFFPELRIERPNGDYILKQLEGIRVYDSLTLDFTRSDSEIIEGDSILYINKSTGTWFSMQWTFNGGIPHYSSEDSVWVVYPAPGKMSTLLSVSNELGAQYLFRDDLLVLPDKNINSPYQVYLFTPQLPAGLICLGLNSDSDGIFDITDHDDDNELKIYPNPASHFIRVESEKSAILKVELYDLSGNKLYAGQGSSYGYDIDLNGFSRGIHILKVFTSREIRVMKVIFK